MKRYIYLQFIIYAILCTACGDTSEAVQQSVITKPQKRVETLNPTPKVISESITVNGNIKTTDHYNLAFPIGGTVSAVWITEGTKVQQGQRIAGVKKIKTPAMMSQNKLRAEQVNFQITQLQSQLETAEKVFTSKEKLFAQDIGSKIALDESRMVVEQLQSQVNQAKSQLSIIEDDNKILQEQSDLHILSAPSSGVITKRMIQTGEQIAAGQIIGYLQPDNNKVSQHAFQCTVSDREIIVLQEGNEVQVTLDAYPHDIINGKISMISSGSASNTGNYEIEILLDKVSKKIMPGMFGSAAISTGTKSEHLAVPLDVLVSANDNQGHVFIIKNNTALKRPIEIHSIYNDQILVQNGLQTSDQLIRNANGLINEGDSLLIVQ